ncbi:hypothetical protein L2E82_49968 [Cichorium intybus]|nr:hypothetical protein L2E82_49968 [Cichorium intybus]
MRRQKPPIQKFSCNRNGFGGDGDGCTRKSPKDGNSTQMIVLEQKKMPKRKFHISRCIPIKTEKNLNFSHFTPSYSTVSFTLSHRRDSPMALSNSNQ